MNNQKITNLKNSMKKSNNNLGNVAMIKMFFGAMIIAFVFIGGFMFGLNSEHKQVKDVISSAAADQAPALTPADEERIKADLEAQIVAECNGDFQCEQDRQGFLSRMWNYLWGEASGKNKNNKPSGGFGGVER